MKRKLNEKTRSTLSDVLLLLGAAAISFGFGLIYLPAGIIVGGLCACGIAFLLVMGGDDHTS
mgnify:CR=1 FL=1